MNTVTALKISFAVVIFVMSMVLLLDSLMAPYTDSVTEEVVASVREALRSRDGKLVTLRVEVWKNGFRVEEVPQ